MKTKIKTTLIGMLVLLAFMSILPNVSADTVDKTTEWVIPADTTIAVTFPTGQGKIQFDNTGNGGNFTDLGATSQICTTTSAIKITNNGNTAVKIEGNWTDDWQTGIEYVNISVGDCTNATFITYGDTNETVKQEWYASLGIGANEDYWMWSTGHEVAEGTWTTDLRITSTNV